MTRLGHLLRSWRITRPPRRLWAAWFAVFALFAQVLVPFGQALAFDANQDIEYQIICTANGVKQIPIGSDGAPIDVQDTTPCPFCLTYSVPALLQPQMLATPLTTQNIAFVFIAHPQHTSIWRGTPRPPRAPPLFV